MEPSAVDMDRLASECEKEELRHTGFIQGHGVFFALDRQGFCLAVSENVAQIGVPVETLLRRDFFSFFKELLPFREHLQSLIPELPRKLGDFRLGQRVWSVVATPSAEIIFLELEPAPAQDASGPTKKNLAPCLYVPHEFAEASDAYKALVRDIQKMIGYDHVMLYQFQFDGSGEVIAEQRLSDAPAYLGHRFPASDIPQIARNLYMKTFFRQVVSIHDRPVAIRTADGQNLDLTHSYLRSVSPVHIEYLRNMKVASSFSVPIILNKQLWGLVTTHAYAPRAVPFDVRIQVAETVRNFCVTLRTMKILEENRWHLRLDQRLLGLADDLIWRDRTVNLSEEGVASICDILGLCGFVLISGDEVSAFGYCPDTDLIHRMMDTFCYDRTRPLFATENVRKRFRYYHEWPDDIGGLIIVQNSFSVGEKRWQYVFFGFRHEMLQTITWAGDPMKNLSDDPTAPRLQPRQSFATWIEERRGCSSYWTHTDKLVARRLVNFIFRSKGDIQRPRIT
ncbi:MAG TPA: GAF domain-containing protein [Oligoflexus sp.]|uniref:GAF domain-containing protein n=1 Tax=Oligoflexus sp. TaxID=1971216 RepID=UPI002D7F99FF|nr:GAF domain-containing protein [Oligoflexus sp.]HET9236180.1 GAF domain-containing protein [Oligoflexus sp.]